MKFNVIGVPLCLGSGKTGAEQGPRKLRDAGLIDVLTRICEQTHDRGDIFVPEVGQEEIYAAGGRIKYLRDIKKVTHDLAQETFNSLEGGAFPLVVGGDHSIALGSISGASAHYDGDLAVIWIDAHGDINTEESSPSGNMHGMPLAALMGYGNEQLVNLYKPFTKVNPRNVFIVGARSLDEGELAIIAKEDLNVYTMPDVKRMGVKAVVSDIKNKIRNSGVNNVHISLDIDVVDPEFAPGTGTIVSDGMHPDELKSLLSGVVSGGNICSMDLVELNPRLDKGDMTTNLCLDIIKYVAEILA